MQTPLDQAQDTLSSARKMVSDGKELYELALKTKPTDAALAGQMEKIALNLLRNGEAMIDKVRNVEKSFSSRY